MGFIKKIYFKSNLKTIIRKQMVKQNENKTKIGIQIYPKCIPYRYDISNGTCIIRSEEKI